MVGNSARLVVILWGCAKHLWDEVTGTLKDQASIRGDILSPVCELHIGRTGFKQLVTSVYQVDDVSQRNLRTKLSRLSLCVPDVLVLNLTVSQPMWRTKGNGKILSRSSENLKKLIRSLYRRRVQDYLHDIIIHIADNEEVHSRHLDALFRPLRRSCNVQSASWDSLMSVKYNLQQLVHAYLRFICTVPSWMMIKWDGQPNTSFPAGVHIGGDIDLLASSESFPQLVARTQRFLDGSNLRGLKLRMVSDPVANNSWHTRSWQARLENERKLVYLFHLVETTNTELLAMIDRRLIPSSAITTGAALAPCLWTSTRADDVRLREIDCIHKWKPKKCSAPSNAIGLHGIVGRLNSHTAGGQRRERVKICGLIKDALRCERSRSGRGPWTFCWYREGKCRASKFWKASGALVNIDSWSGIPNFTQHVTQATLFRFNSSQSDADDGCFQQYDCGACKAIPGCAYCHRQARVDIKACINQTSYPTFCPSEDAAKHSSCKDRWISRTDVPLYEAADVDSCARMRCSNNKQRCRVPLLPWLLRDPRNPHHTFSIDDFPRFDIFVKMAILELWLHNESWGDGSYANYILERTSSHVDGSNMRLRIFRGLLRSVRTTGLDFRHSPIVVRSDFSLLDGSHRVAAALAFGYTHVELLRTTCKEWRDHKGALAGGAARKQTVAMMVRLFNRESLRRTNGSAALFMRTMALANRFINASVSTGHAGILSSGLPSA